ncbi:MAG TPA: BlaI/MecI/CopY family transcriptional regulator, partial [Chloroflexia bacterium]|nr:BlaI/MecI/CopY family transcriptional regulator [Chloroflexia bacterium]
SRPAPGISGHAPYAAAEAGGAMGGFGELEAAVMDRMWRATTPRSVRDVLEDLQRDRVIAYTTVLTVLERLFRKGLVQREAVNRAYLYSATQSREDYTAGVMAEALANATDKLATLVRFAERVSPREARQLLMALTDRGRKR